MLEKNFGFWTEPDGGTSSGPTEQGHYGRGNKKRKTFKENKTQIKKKLNIKNIFICSD